MMHEENKYTNLMASVDLTRRTFMRSVASAGFALPLASMLGASTALAEATPKKGGTFRFVCMDGSPANTLEAGIANSWTEIAGQSALYDPLFEIGGDGAPKLKALESAEPDATASKWILKLREARFHDGRPVTAEDLAFSLKRIVDPKAPKAGAAALATLDVSALKVLDERTLSVSFTQPFSLLPDILSVFWNFRVVPKDFDPKNPVGSGPFKFKSFQPGQAAEFTRFDDYWNGAPHLDSLMMINLADETAAFNALQGGQVDAISSASFNLAKQVSQDQGGPIRALVSAPAQNIVLTMRADQAPFDNPDVRMALKLLVDRPQMVKLAIAGYGNVSDDLFSRFDPLYDNSLQRAQDIEKAKALLKKAGQENLSIELITAPAIGGMVEQAQIFARQALKAGVTVTVNQVTADLYTTKYYAQSAFSQDYFGYFPFFAQVAQSMLPGAGANTTYWQNKEFLALYDKAQRTVDPKDKMAIAKQMQEIEFADGAYIVPMSASTIDLLSSNVQGLEPSAIGYTLGGFAFEKVWLS